MSTPAPASSRTLSQSIAEFVLSDRIAALPDDVMTKARTHSLDAIGVALAASTFDFGAAVSKGVGELEPSEPTSQMCSVMGGPRRFTPARAALINGTLMHGLDFDDTHIAGIYHATAPALAAAIAVGESVAATRDETVAAYGLGLEVGCRLSLAAPGQFHAHGFHPTGIIGTFAAACVAARLRKDSVETLSSALGLCGSMAAGILEIKGSWLKRLHPGLAASSGITAVTLASAGFRGPAEVLEGPAGLFISHTGAEPDESAVVEGLGETWEMLDLALKPYPCCHFLHASIDAVRRLRAEFGNQLRVDDVESIEVAISEDLFSMIVEPVDMRRAPTSPYDALFSLAYVTAVALHEDDVTLSRFYGGQLDEPEILAWSNKITCVPDPASTYPESFPGEVNITTTQGAKFRSRVEYSRGTSAHPMTAADVLGKFVTNASFVMSPEAARQQAERWLDGSDEPLGAVLAQLESVVTTQEVP